MGIHDTSAPVSIRKVICETGSYTKRRFEEVVEGVSEDVEEVVKQVDSVFPELAELTLETSTGFLVH